MAWGRFFMPDILRKTFTPSAVSLKADAPGTLTVEFATLNTVDLDGDVTLPGAFGAQDVRIQSHGHDTYRWSIGKGTIGESGDKAVLTGLLNLEMAEGKEAYASLKFDLEHGAPLQEWSYVYRVLDADFGDFEGRPVRFLKRLKVLSVDPVFLGAGIGTQTTALKGADDLTFSEHCEQTAGQIAALLARVKSRADLRATEGRALSASNVTKLSGIVESLTAVAAELGQLLADADPKQADALAREALRYQRIRADLLGVA